MRSRDDQDLIPQFIPDVPMRASAYPEDLDQIASGLTDEEAMKKIGQRTTLGGKILTLVLVGSVAGLAYAYVQRSAAYEARMDGVKAAGALKDGAMLSALRTELSNSEYPDVKVRAIRNLAHFKDKQSVPMLTQASPAQSSESA